jgi:tRNA (cytidine/uridine-2'-O-)-methyltransferase
MHPPVIDLALFQPEIPQNCGAVMRLAACMGVRLHLIAPFGFVWDETRIRRVGMDYIDLAAVTRHDSWEAFRAETAAQRLILLTTKAETAYDSVAYQPGDILLLGRESSGAPDFVHEAAGKRVTIPMAGGARSLNVAVTAGMVLGEALRQTRGA